MEAAKYLKAIRRAIFTVSLNKHRPHRIQLMPFLVGPRSLDAIQGALGTVCEAVDTVLRPSEMAVETTSGAKSCAQAFVAVRPPGHHCGEVSKPCGMACASTS